MDLPFIKQEEPAEYFLQIDEQQAFDTILNGFDVKEIVNVITKCEPDESQPTTASEYDPGSKGSDGSEDEDINETQKRPFKVFKCDKCPFANRRDHFIQHLARHNQPGLDQCKECYRFFHESQMERHIEKKHIGAPYACPYCTKIFVCYKSYVNHKSLHSGIRLECDICGNVYRQRSTLWDHMKNLHCERSKDYKCHICEVAFYRRNTLNRHMKQLHSGITFPEERLRCSNPSCNRLIKLSSFKFHKCSQKRQTRFTCPECETSFSSQHLLTKHTKTPCSSKNLSCDKCKKGFKKLHNYLKHCKIDCSKFVRFECDYCSTLFSQKRSLRNHFSVDHGITDAIASCSICKRILSSKAKLKKHMEMVNHADITCEFCNRVFSRKVKCANHLKRCKLRTSKSFELENL